MKVIFVFTVFVTIAFGGFSVSRAEHECERGTDLTVEFQNANSINGFVFGPDGQPAADVYVELLGEMGSTLSRAKTNGSGMYSFRGLSDGTFTVRVQAYGKMFADVEQRISLVGISAVPGRGSINEQVDFYLRPLTANSGPLAAPEVIFAQEVPAKAKGLYQEGIELISDKRDSEGFEKLKAALEIFPTYYLALDRLGTEYVVRGHYRPAHVLLEMSLAVNPRGFSSRLGLGISQFHLGLADDSIRNLKLATETYGGSVNAFYWLGVALEKQSRLREAEAALVTANRLSKGGSADVHWHLGQIYKDQARYAEAADELAVVIKIKPGHASAENIKKAIRIMREKAANSEKQNARANHSN